MSDPQKVACTLDQNFWVLRGREKNSQERRAQTIEFYLSIDDKDIILDVGCGEGFITSRFLKANYIVGLDISMDFLMLAKHKIGQSGIDFVCADATALPLRTASFDKIATLEVLEHLHKEEQELLSNEVNRVLRDQGLLVISVPYNEEIVYTRCIHCGELTPLWGHLHSLNEEKLTILLPTPYTLLEICHLPNLSSISLSKIFTHLPFRLWLVLNNLLGKVNIGRWIILKYRKTGNSLN
jgi:ubiquinone/menaquinone biosynthesis C-methylase UbiE